jgi:LytS/YehU family sensor histidine kinase
VKNQTGEFSSAVPVTFTIAKPFYFEWWFLVLSIAIPILFIGLILKRSISKIKKREAEKTANFNKLAEAELKTLRAQMNPHFMFNTLNAVQELVLNGNDELSRIYFADFAKMMRMILHNSTEKFISLEKEIDFLQLYLKFEKIRFQEKFEVIFTIDPALETFNIRIPGMIIQPIIENAINHGLLHRKEGGILEITLQEIHENGKNKLVCCVKDNGIGLKNTSSLNSNKEEGYRSMSSLITKERIELLNMIYGAGKYALTINEIDESGNYKGTKVELKIEIEA